jgi:hypothetical protein
MWENVRNQVQEGFLSYSIISNSKTTWNKTKRQWNSDTVGGRCAEILSELKTKTDIQEVNIQFKFNAAKTAAYNWIEWAIRVRITWVIKQKTQALIFNLISGFYLIAGFKAEIRAVLM